MSIFPYSIRGLAMNLTVGHTYRGEFRSDSGRRRHPSSSTRPVSSTDYPDLYHLLGLTKPGDGQVSSYLQRD